MRRWPRSPSPTPDKPGLAVLLTFCGTRRSPELIGRYVRDCVLTGERLDDFKQGMDTARREAGARTALQGLAR